MYVALIRGSTFAGVLGATLVQKIFYTAIGVFVYLYLFLSVPGTFDLQLGIVDNHRLLVPLLIVGGIVLLYLVVKKFWSKVEKLWDHAKQGGAILANKRDYVVKVLLPSFGSWLAKLAVIGVFLAAYNIPVTFHTIMSVVGGNSLANTRVVHARRRRRHAGREQRLALEVTSPTNAAAYSLGQQIIVTAWNCVFALVLVVWVFGWTGGKQLVGESYTGAKEKAAEQSAAHKARRAEKKAAKQLGRRRLICSPTGPGSPQQADDTQPVDAVGLGNGRTPGRFPSSSKEPAVVAASYPFLDVLWSMVIFFLFVIWIWILITVFADIFRRRDIGGGMKAVWIIFVILLPYLGVFIYLIAEGHHMAERNAEQMQAVRAQQDDYIKSVAGSSPADQIAQAKSLLDSGAITPGRVRRPQGQGTELGTQAGPGRTDIGAPGRASQELHHKAHRDTRICESGRIRPGRTRSSRVERRPNMCRWLAYSGSPVLLEELLVKPDHSLIDQSKHSRLGATTTNGDGFGVGWYGAPDTPGVFHGTEPAWNDRNLRDIAAHISSPLVFAHIRASTGTAVQETNCHPFRHDNWLWMHNGAIRDFPRVKRDLALAVDPSLYPLIEGSTDSELFFFLALTLGLEDDPPLAVERAVGLIEETGRRHDVEHPIQMTVATTDGDSIWAFRYSSEHDSRSLFFSTDGADAPPPVPGQPRAPRPLRRDARSCSRSRSATSPGRGTRCRSRAGASSRRGRTSCTRSRRGAQPEQLRDRPRLEGAAGGGVRRARRRRSRRRSRAPTLRGARRGSRGCRRRGTRRGRAASTYGPISHGHTVPW